MTHLNRNRTARAERIVDVVLAEFGPVIRKISMRDAMVAATAAALGDPIREGQQTPCLSALASGDACQPDESIKRCAICGFVVDLQFAAEKPTVRMRRRCTETAVGR
jgi:hypothetical protein